MSNDELIAAQELADEKQRTLNRACAEAVKSKEAATAKRAETQNLTGRELDAAVAREVMGDELKPSKLYPGRYLAKDDDDRWHYLDAFSSDANAAALVLAEIERRGLKFDFVLTFASVTMKNKPGLYPSRWECFTASPEAICLAALAAVRGDQP